MKQESETKPTTKFVIENINNDKCEVVFYDLDSIEEKNKLDEEEKKTISYFYYSFRIEMPYHYKLKDYINNHYEELLSNAKYADRAYMAQSVRNERNKLLTESDKEVALDRIDIPDNVNASNATKVIIDFFNSVHSAWATYRQKLRDIPEQEGFPYNIEWPEKPIK